MKFIFIYYIVNLTTHSLRYKKPVMLFLLILATPNGTKNRSSWLISRNCFSHSGHVTIKRTICL